MISSLVKNEEKNMDDLSLKAKFILGLVGFIAFVALLTSLGSFVVINPGERGVVVRWGKVSDTILSEGLNWKTPFIEDVDRMNIRIQKFEAPLMTASSRDMQSVKNRLIARYAVSKNRGNSNLSIEPRRSSRIAPANRD